MIQLIISVDIEPGAHYVEDSALGRESIARSIGIVLTPKTNFNGCRTEIYGRSND